MIKNGKTFFFLTSTTSMQMHLCLFFAGLKVCSQTSQIIRSFVICSVCTVQIHSNWIIGAISWIIPKWNTAIYPLHTQHTTHNHIKYCCQSNILSEISLTHILSSSFGMFSVGRFTFSLCPLHHPHRSKEHKRSTITTGDLSALNNIGIWENPGCFFHHWNFQSKNKYHQPVCVCVCSCSVNLLTKPSDNINRRIHNMQRSCKNFWHEENHIVCKCCNALPKS